LERIKTTVKWKWDSKEDLQNYRKESEVEEDRDNEEGSEDGPGESQEKKTLLSASY